MLTTTSSLNKAHFFALQFLCDSFKHGIILADVTSMRVKHNRVVIRLTGNHQGIHLYPSTESTLFKAQAICPCFVSALSFPLFLILHSVQQFRSILITEVQLELAFQFSDVATVEIARCQLQLFPSPTASWYAGCICLTAPVLCNAV